MDEESDPRKEGVKNETDRKLKSPGGRGFFKVEVLETEEAKEAWR
jgi:hypothetical protein